MEPLVLKTDSAVSQLFFTPSFDEMGEKLRDLLPQNRRIVAIADRKVDALYGHFFPYEKISVFADEGEKTMETVLCITRRLMELGAGRDTFLLGIGGGITTDICGFVASIYKRGVGFGFVPTTLLSMVDAAIGGKNGVNVDGYKNMLGTINQPRFVIACPCFLSSFSKSDICKSVPELLKTCLISGKHFDEVAGLFRRMDFSGSVESEELLGYIREAVEVKCEVVAADERESGRRRILNLGHTFAHALERCTENRLSHGEAVGIGLVLAAKNGGAERVAGRIAAALGQLDLPTQIPEYVGISELNRAVLQDKKNSGSHLNLVVIDEAGTLSFRQKSVVELLWK
jgi:3-dehydroquinate synthase